MNAGSDNKLLMKLTIAADETPELFRALASVKDARRRTGRLKDLASKGFMVERSGIGISASEPAPRVAGSTAEGLRHLPPGDTVASMLDWEHS
ncbi:hypothetical protein [uncultured Methylibium sp.]|uniref:hypothetical protein n=1 Tax=uncultured Methylibium sp. TaxID=381093 RepID=UPI0025DAB281|nr:hypothetical protein [uncultured Methylibium sp.]